MLSPRLCTLALLLAIAMTLAACNLWYAAKRSTIPLQLEAYVVRKETRREKHPGHDDVCLLHLSSEIVLHVDCQVFQRIPEGAAIRKGAWERQLFVDGVPLDLEWSADFRGMAYAMPLTLIVLVATAFATRSGVGRFARNGVASD